MGWERLCTLGSRLGAKGFVAPVPAAFLVLVCAAWLAKPSDAQPAARTPVKVIAATTGNDSELVTTLPIATRPWRRPRVAMSLTPADLPTLHEGDLIKASAELMVSTTCVDPGPRCIGRRYRFSPVAQAKLILADARSVTGGRGAVKLATPKSVRCSQRGPDRNHHCVLVFQNANRRILDPSDLPCPPTRCFINLVAEAHSSSARRGNVLVVGADKPDGYVNQDKGRLNAVVVRPGAAPPDRSRSRQRLRRKLPVLADGAHLPRVVYSLKLSHPHAGDVLVATVSQRTSIGGLPYSVLVSHRVILAASRVATSTSPLAMRVSSSRGQFGENNGFNCTQGPSAYRSPCLSTKAGLIRIRRAPSRNGHPVPLYVNLICYVLPKSARPGRHDSARVLAHGSLAVVRYAPHAHAWPQS
jgi:hypothetical protein